MNRSTRKNMVLMPWREVVNRLAKKSRHHRLSLERVRQIGDEATEKMRLILSRDPEVMELMERYQR